MGKNIGLISTRFAKTDGVTLESGKWAQMLRSMGHNGCGFAGRLDTVNFFGFKSANRTAP